MKKISFIFCALLVINFVQANKKNYSISSNNIKAGTEVLIGKKKIKLHTGNDLIAVGKSIFTFLDKKTKFPKLKNKVTLINVVPSIDTPVCEEQSHILGESKNINQEISRVTISRDLPMAQRRFAKEAKLENIHYISDFNDAEFGKKSGLLMSDNGLLARAVIVTDEKGIIRYMQIVPKVSELPDMKKAINFANNLATQK
ncbi:redoxin family protein [Bacteriovoracaceae bacterium]|nr:redoxin family protein [Bacteriovoracaceae bacterium]